MTIQELLHTFAFEVQEGMSDDQIGEQAEHLAKKVETLVRKETIEDILKLKTAYHVRTEKIKEYAQSKGITL